MPIYDFQATADRIAEIFRAVTIDTDGNEIKPVVSGESFLPMKLDSARLTSHLP